MDNSTLGRKAGNDMKKNASIAKMGDSPASWQKADKGLGFNGQDNGSEQRSGKGKYAYNQHSGTSNDGALIQERQMPVKKGYIGDVGQRPRRAPATAGASANPVESGKRSWAPSAGQNFRGNPDKIQDRQLFNNRGNKD
jgi:hypothetical protein